MRQPALVRNLTGNLVCSHRLLRYLLRREGGGEGRERERERERGIEELVTILEGEKGGPT